MLRGVSVALALFALASPAGAQDEARARTLRDEGRAAEAEGRYEDAFARFREAVALTDDALAWRELAEAADRLRLDAVALSSYETYLEERPDAPDRAAIEGRLRILRQLLAGGRYVPREGGRSVHLLVDWEGRPLITEHVANPYFDGARPAVLVDWQGRPVPVERALSSARGALRADGLGRALAPPR